VPQNFIEPERDQLFLLPQDVREWVPPDDIGWTVLQVVGGLDLSGFYARYRDNGQGAAAFHPKMMIGLIIYAHAVGVRSSRAIERACGRDAGFKMVTGLLRPDHCTITRFVRDHREVLGEVFGQVLRVCAAAGLVKVGVIAVDGTKIAANASWAKAYTAAALAHQIAEEKQRFADLAASLLAEQVQADDAEDAVYGAQQRGDELPPQLRHLQERLTRLEAAQQDLAAREEAAREAMRAEQKAKQAAYDERSRTGRTRGPRPADEVPVKEPKVAPRASTTDPDSRRMKAKHGFVQGYNAQAAVTEDQVIVGAQVTQAPTDHHVLPEVLDTVEKSLTAAGVPDRPDTVVADAGYANEDTFKAAEDANVQLLAPLDSDEKRVRGDASDPPLVDPKRRPATARAQHLLNTDAGRELYLMRGRTVEPVFGQLKERGGMRQFARRGLAAVNAEFKWACTVHNIRKLHTFTLATATG
jgi:transposase